MGDDQPPALGWQGRDVLTVLQGMEARPSVPISVQRLMHNWANRFARNGNKAFGAGVDQLAEAGLIEPVNGDSEDVILTEKGHAV